MSEVRGAKCEVRRGLVGHEAVLASLERALANGRLAHAYLITGPKQVGKRTLALKLATHILGGDAALNAHPDFMLVERGEDPKTGKPRSVIAIDQIHALRGKLSRRPMLDGWQVAIIRDAQLMNREAANALLKTLEEPRDRTLLMLTAPDTDSVLPTVRSRCQEVRLDRVSREEIERALETVGQTRTDASLLARLADGCPGRALRLAAEPETLVRLRDLRQMAFGLVGTDFAARWRAVEQILPKKHAFQEAGASAQEFLDVMAELLRDAVLLRHGQNGRIVHIDAIDSVRRWAESELDLVLVASELQLARKRIRENVGPRAVLQQFVLAL